MSRQSIVFVPYDYFLEKKEHLFSSLYRGLVIECDHKLTYLDIYKIVLTFHGDMKSYLGYVVNNVIDFESEDGTFFTLSIPNFTLRDIEKECLYKLLEKISPKSATHKVEEISSWYNFSEGFIYLTISNIPRVDYWMDINIGENGRPELVISANARYHYYLSESGTQGEIKQSLYEETKDALHEFSENFGDLDYLRKFEKNGIFFISNEDYYNRDLADIM